MLKLYYKAIPILASQISSSPRQCFTSLHQAVTSQAEISTHLKGLFLAIMND